MFNNQILNKIINLKKPITLEKYIDLCLYSKKGYYNNSRILGKKGDFITAPEISQLFGELIGLFIFSTWKEKIKKPFNLVEIGPGNGTALIDILNITRDFIKFQQNMKIKLIEINSILIKEQKKNLKKFKLNRYQINWLKKFKLTNNRPTIIYTNEFFDCLPIRQFYKKDNIWFEKMVTYNEKDECLKIQDTKIKKLNTLNEILKYESDTNLEISKKRNEYFAKICEHINSFGGIILIFDYGYFNRPNYFTLQSIYNNKKTNILDNIGEQDITSLVDFKQLTIIAKSYNLNIDIMTTQRDFLLKYGINERAEKIMENSNSTDKKIIKEGLERLIDKNNMGSLFKVLVVSK